jgi:hypothetical protein
MMPDMMPGWWRWLSCAAAQARAPASNALAPFPDPCDLLWGTMVEARWRHVIVSADHPLADEQVAEAIARVLSRLRSKI